MNNQNLLIDYVAKAEYNDLLKPFLADIVILNKYHPHIVAHLVENATDKETLCKYIKELALDTRGHTRKGFHPNIMYFLLTLYINYRPTPCQVGIEFTS